MVKQKAIHGLLILLGVLIIGTSAQIVFAEDYYIRWTEPLPAVLCDSGGGNQYLGVNDPIYYEYNLPEDATIQVSIFENGVLTDTEEMPAPSGMGSVMIPGSYSGSIAASYYDYMVRFDTVVDGKVVYISSLTLSCPSETATIVNQAFGGVCDIPLLDGSVVGDMPFATQAFYAPGKISPDVTLNAGTYWVLGQDESGEYYKIMLSCQYLWVPVDSMQPSYQAPWSGEPLPTRDVS